MLPIGDTKLQAARTPYLNWIVILINVAVFIYQLTLSQEELHSFIMEYGVVPVDILNGENYISLITAMFIHGGWLHIIGNMLFLWVFGDNIEAVVGHFWYIVFYLMGGIAASAAHVIFNAESIIPSIGASGAVSAMLGAYLVWFPSSKVKMLVPIFFFITVVRVYAWIFLFVWIGIQLFFGLAAIGQSAQTTGVAWWAHLGGFIFGLAIGIIIRVMNPQPINKLKS
jgi:membrane associated rhomboid family serine protease